MSISFFSESFTNMAETVKEYKESTNDPKRYILCAVTMKSSEGNEYAYVGFDFNEAPDESVLRGCAEKEFYKDIYGIDERHTESYEGYEDIKEQEIREYLESYRIVDITKIKENVD